MFDEKDFQSRNVDDTLWKSLFPGMYILICSVLNAVGHGN